MAEDASLDEFVDDGSTASTDGNAAATESGAAETAADGVDPATTTYAWSGDGAACAACGTVVERRWQQDGSLVCSACKEW